MAINFAAAVNAYQKVASKDSLPGLGSNKASGGDFADVLRNATQDAIGAVREGERQSLAAAAGTADLTDVVTAVGRAELTLQTVVSLRDRVIQAYQDVLRMPI
ncbi:MAG TPA: flagellar hook-basal body complex protein FliE [Kiloniellales bacterium]|jgi:flagellar hook-basal body complex protein FliE